MKIFRLNYTEVELNIITMIKPSASREFSCEQEDEY